MEQTHSTIAEQVARMNEGRTPSPVYSAEQKLLASAPVTNTVLTVGSTFPDGDLTDAEGRPTSLRAVLGGAPGVVIFYRGAWCPYCNIALRTYREQLASPLSALGVVLVAISPQAADGSMTMKEKHSLEFSVLSDPGNQIAGALGILTQPSNEARAAQLQHGLDIAKVNADGTTVLPMPTTAIVDSSGKLAWIDVHPDHTTRSEPIEILDAVGRLMSPGSS
jgi:peroxiredoxin